MLIKSAVGALMLVSALSFILLFVLLGEAKPLVQFIGIVFLPAVSLGSFRLAEKLYKARLATGKR